MQNQFNLNMQLCVRTALFKAMTDRDIMPLDSMKISNAIVDAMEQYNKDHSKGDQNNG